MLLVCAVLPRSAAGQPYAPVRFSTVLGYFVDDTEGDDLDEYMWDWRTALDFSLVTVDEIHSLWLTSRIAVVAGRQPRGLGVDPRLVDIGFGLLAESKFRPVTTWVSLDHASFHLVDLDLATSIWYWRLVFGAGSAQGRAVLDELTVPATFSVPSTAPVEWGITMSWWPEEMPIIKDESSKGNPWVFSTLGALSVPVLRRGGFEVMLNSRTGLERDRSGRSFRGIDLTGDWHAHQTLGIQISRSTGTYVWGATLDAVVADDRWPRFNRSGLVRFAVTLGN
ncbi:MAG: hypothetical protein OEZ37_03300 [Gemmatimonadota bacterium]|nr:hypothetical protein [Gemmatimonadota bacterium]